MELVDFIELGILYDTGYIIYMEDGTKLMWNLDDTKGERRKM